MRQPLTTVPFLSVGATVYTSRTGRVSYEVVNFVPDHNPAYPPLVLAERGGKVSTFALAQLWVTT